MKALESEADASSDCSSMPSILGANIVPHADSSLLESDVPVIDTHSVFSYEGGDVGVIGINVARKTMESSQPDEGTTLLDEIETTKAQVAELRALGLNKIIVVTHIGLENDLEWIASIEGVDVVIGGDSHSLLGDDKTKVIATPRGSYATIVEKPDGSKTCVVQAWDYSKLIGKLDVDFDDDGNVVSCAGNPVFPLNPDKVTVRDANPRYDLSAEDAAVVIESLFERTGGQALAFSEDLATAKDLEAYALEVEELTKEVVGVASEFIGLEGGGYESGACDLVAQAFLLQPLSTADVAIQNRGGCRASIEEVSFGTIDDKDKTFWH